MTTIRRPAEIRPTHLARKAVVYIRQSSADQVEKNTGSTDYQRGLEQRARDWGWRDVTVVDEDLGLSGSASAHRGGYLAICRQIEAGAVGLLLMADMTRGGRDAVEWLMLIRLLQTHDVLLAIDGRVEDLSNESSKLTTQLLSVIGEHENVMRCHAMRRGRDAKLDKGAAVTKPPTGYVRGEDGAWLKDPSPGVQEAIAAVFRHFATARTCRRTVDALRANRFRLPVRKRDGLRWTAPMVQSVYRILTNPQFTGDYAVGRRESDARLGRDARGRIRHRLRDAAEIRVVENHHEPYISKAEFGDIAAILKLNGASASRRNLGGGAALCQGIIHCARHAHHLLTAIYKAPLVNGSAVHAYVCQGFYAAGGDRCGVLNGPRIDALVVAELLQRLAPPRIDVALDALKRSLADEQREASRHTLELQRARLEAQHLESRFLHVDSTSLEVLKVLEHHLETARRRVAALEGLVPPGVAARTDAADARLLAELRPLCADVAALWHAPTTTVQDRKQLIRLMIRDIVLDVLHDERVQLRILWADADEATVIGYARDAYTTRLVMEMADDGIPSKAIAARMNELGVWTVCGTAWTPHTIAAKIRREKRKRQEPTSARTADARAGHP